MASCWSMTTAHGHDRWETLVDGEKEPLTLAKAKAFAEKHHAKRFEYEPDEETET
jgi:hypothetical protein